MRKKKELSIAQKIKKVREDRGWTIPEFALILGIRSNRLFKYEAHGKYYCVMPPADMFEKITSYKRGE